MIYKTASVVYRLVIFIFLILYCVATFLVGVYQAVSKTHFLQVKVIVYMLQFFMKLDKVPIL